MEPAVRASRVAPLLFLVAACGEPCVPLSRDGRALVERCGKIVQVSVDGRNVFIGDEVMKIAWLSESRLRVSYPMDSHVHSRESPIPALRVEYEALPR